MPSGDSSEEGVAIAMPPLVVFAPIPTMPPEEGPNTVGTDDPPTDRVPGVAGVPGLERF